MVRYVKLFLSIAIVSIPAGANAQMSGGYGAVPGSPYGPNYSSSNGQGYGPGYVPIYGSGANPGSAPATASPAAYAGDDVMVTNPRTLSRPVYPDGLVDPSANLPSAPLSINSPPLIATPAMGSTNMAAGIGGAGSPSPVSGELDGKLLESGWYVGMEYLHWNERVGGQDFVNESGAFYTLGYMHQLGIERYRAELFGGDIHYSGFTQGGDTAPDPLSSNTGYLGLSGQYELVLAPPSWGKQAAILVGVGSRFWIRDLHDGTSFSGYQVYGYDEIWWTMYPFVGLETSRPTGSGWDLFSDFRCGPTCLTYQDVSINTRPLWPKTGVYAQGEAGIRTDHFHLEAYCEFMDWGQSSVVEGSFQPKSTMYGMGTRTGVTF